jgi:hypothetical protein
MTALRKDVAEQIQLLPEQIQLSSARHRNTFYFIKNLPARRQNLTALRKDV